MNTFNEGDLIQATRGNDIIRGRLVDVDGNSGRAQLALTDALTVDPLHLDANGFTITLIEKAAPALPTTTGIVVRISAGNGRRYWLAWYSNTGDWDVIDPRGDYHHAHPDPYQLVRDYQEPIDGFEVLEPATFTAKRVLDRVRGLFGEGALILNEVDEIATEFGVTS